MVRTFEVYSCHCSYFCTLGRNPNIIKLIYGTQFYHSSIGLSVTIQPNSSFLGTQLFSKRLSRTKLHIPEGTKHKQQCSVNSEIVPLVIWVVLRSSYNSICGIFGNVTMKVWIQSKQVERRNIKYKIYFNHIIENSAITECIDYLVFPAHVNVTWPCRSI